MNQEILKKVKGFYFMAVAVMMYYFIVEYIDIGTYVTCRHVFALVLIFSAVLMFLYKPDVARGVTVVRDACVYSIPLGVIIVVSLFIWFVNTVDTSTIARGLSSSLIFVNMLSMALGAGVMLYVFGKKGVWYNLAAILIANILMILSIIAQYGLGAYVSELVALITSFADVTGDIIVQAEIHELAFCLGAYLTYMLYKPKKSVAFVILLLLSLFCFLSALKRIAVIAIVIALAFGYVLKFIAKYSPKTATRLITLLCILLFFVLLGYIALIEGDFFALLEKAGIHTSGRVGIYDAVDDFYEFSPSFLGNGIGFMAYQLTKAMDVGVASVHNDFLQFFIDLGFWGYIIWLVAMTLVRIWYFGRKGNVDNAILTFVLMVYLIISSATDNTMNYPLLTGVLALLMMSGGFEENVRTMEYKLFGCVSTENREEGGARL